MAIACVALPGGDMFAEEGAVIALRKVGDVRGQKTGGEIDTQFGDIGRCVGNEAVPIEPDHDIAGRFLQQAMQHMTFDVTQTDLHTETCPSNTVVPNSSPFVRLQNN